MSCKWCRIVTRLKVLSAFLAGILMLAGLEWLAVPPVLLSVGILITVLMPDEFLFWWRSQKPRPDPH